MKRLIYLLSLVLVSLNPLPALGAAPDDAKAIINNTIYSSSGSAASCSLGGDVGTLTGADNREKIWNWLTAKGLSAVQAAGIMGNISVESASSWSPTIQQIGSPWPTDGWGLAQWTGGRRISIVKALSKQPDIAKYYDEKYDGTTTKATGYIPAGISEADENALILFELNYLYQESTNRPVTAAGFSGKNEWDALTKQTTIDNATVFWHNNFEVSGQDAASVLRDRGGAAQDAYDDFHGKTGASAAGSPDCTDISGANGVVQATVLKYAWPTYHSPNFFDMEPAYATAVATDQKAGHYVGAPAGIDCGGFVTMVMVDSGFEPKYNSAHGNTDAQMTWAQANWQDLGPASSIDTGKLQPGDVAISHEHTFLWVGDMPKGSGWDKKAKIASASTGSDTEPYYRSAMADPEQSPTEAGFEWYRKK